MIPGSAAWIAARDRTLRWLKRRRQASGSFLPVLACTVCRTLHSALYAGRGRPLCPRWVHDTLLRFLLSVRLRARVSARAHAH
eukprot:1654935-Pleurochrysis_carterae.AAC.1